MSGAYGSRARLGIGPPQANPTVEPEISELLPPGVAMYVSRLTSRRADAKERLIEYLDQLDTYLDRFDTLKLDGYGFACTGSTYFHGVEKERRIVDKLSEKRGYPIITCAMAIADALKHLGAERIAIYSPYPQWLHDASESHWRQQGFNIVATHTIAADSGDTRQIYGQNPGAVAAKMLASDPGADVGLITGTGLPSLSIIKQVTGASGRVVLSSNLCLAWRLLLEVDQLPLSPESLDGYPLLSGWLNSG